jgi:3',5'-cyclic-AMP phosphodiesterase
MMSRFSALPREPEHASLYSRRHFLRQALGAGAFTLAGGFGSTWGQTNASAGPAPFRFAFLTDLHLLQGGALRSVEGISACLEAVKKLRPQPEFILCGGDLVNSTRELTLPGAEAAVDYFIQLWKYNTNLPTFWTFGNHDLAGTSNHSVPTEDKEYGKGLFQDRFQLPKLFYSFDHKGWHFVVLDDIALQADRTYMGELFDDEFAFLQADLDAHRAMPTIVCTHIPVMSNIPLGLSLAHLTDPKRPLPSLKTLVCTNGDALLSAIRKHNVRVVLAGHLHFYEHLDHDGVQIINSGAVCANYWKGPNHGCPEGFGVVDVGADGSVKFDYQTYGWKVA